MVGTGPDGEFFRNLQGNTCPRHAHIVPVGTPVTARALEREIVRRPAVTGGRAAAREVAEPARSEQCE